MEKIGFVGTGAMGSGLLSRLKLANVSAVSFDITPKGQEAARAEGAQTLNSAKEVAQACTIIDVVVRTDQEVLDCMLGENGVVEGAAPGSLVLLHSTIRPTTTKKVAQAAADKRVNVIDACMTAVPSVVRQGGLTFLVGGQKALFDRAKPHLLNMAKDAVHMGPLGCGNVTKLFKNMVTASEALVVYEALQIAKAGGIGYKAALDLDAENPLVAYPRTLGHPLPTRRQRDDFQSRHQSLRQRSAARRRSRQSARRRDSGGRSARGIGN